MTEIEAVMARHSVRDYLDRKIEQEKLNELEELIIRCNEEGNIHMQLLPDAGKTFGRLMNKVMKLSSAPSVIACAGPDDETVEERIGFYGEKVVLLAQQLGLNTCWAGTFNAKGTPAVLEDGEKLFIVIAIGYGKTQGRPHKSKTYEQVVAGTDEKPEWFRRGVELALLAPTAINQQKFIFHLKDDGQVEVEAGKGPFSRIDKGIVRYHFDIGSIDELIREEEQDEVQKRE